MPIIRSSKLYLCYCRIWCVMPWLLVVGGQVQGSRPCVWDGGNCSSSFPHPGRIACCPAPDRRPPTTKALHTICGNNTSVVSSPWWWAYKCPKHIEQIISAIKYSVASSWFPSLRSRLNLLYVLYPKEFPAIQFLQTVEITIRYPCHVSLFRGSKLNFFPDSFLSSYLPLNFVNTYIITTSDSISMTYLTVGNLSPHYDLEQCCLILFSFSHIKQFLIWVP